VHPSALQLHDKNPPGALQSKQATKPKESKYVCVCVCEKEGYLTTRRACKATSSSYPMSYKACSQ